jgi:hypothetical protein
MIQKNQQQSEDIKSHVRLSASQNLLAAPISRCGLITELISRIDYSIPKRTRPVHRAKGATSTNNIRKSKNIFPVPGFRAHPTASARSPY